MRTGRDRLSTPAWVVTTTGRLAKVYLDSLPPSTYSFVGFIE